MCSRGSQIRIPWWNDWSHPINEFGDILCIIFKSHVNINICVWIYRGYGRPLCGNYSISTYKNVPQTFWDTIDGIDAKKYTVPSMKICLKFKRKESSRLIISKIDFMLVYFGNQTSDKYIKFPKYDTHVDISCSQGEPFINHILSLHWLTATKLNQTTAVQKTVFRKSWIMRFAMQHKRSYILL